MTLRGCEMTLKEHCEGNLKRPLRDFEGVCAVWPFKEMFGVLVLNGNLERLLRDFEGVCAICFFLRDV